jgi:hypothetical protein
MADFWPGCGYRLLGRNAEGRLMVSNEFLQSFLGRPELAPVTESCAAERALHDRLMEAPGAPVAGRELEAIADPDARDNYRHFLRFRDMLLAAGTIEGCYGTLFSGGRVDIPPLFVDHLCQLIVRNLLDGTGDALEARAAELLFRAQQVMIKEGIALAADAGAISLFSETDGLGNLGRLMGEARIPVRGLDLQVLTHRNADLYWMRGERFDTVLPVSAGQPGAEALCRVLERWVRHFHDTPVSVIPVRRVDGERWHWHVGLDAEATALLNDLYLGHEPGDERRQRLLCLFELRFLDPSAPRPDVAGRPVHLGMAMNAGGILKLKPQNLLLNLPIARAG